MALLTAGYWQTTYWPGNFWNDKYWQNTVLREALYKFIAKNLTYNIKGNDTSYLHVGKNRQFYGGGK